MRLLIRAPNWLGDLAMSLPLFESVRDLHPTIVAKEGLGKLLQPYGEVLTFRGKNDLLRISLTLRTRSFDVGIVIPPSLSSALLTRLANPKKVIGYATDFRSFLLTHPIKAHVRQRHFVYEILDLIKFAGLDVNTPTIVQPRFQKEEITTLENFMDKTGLHKREYFIIAPFAKFGEAKEWYLQGFIDVSIEIQRKTGLIPVFVGTKDEAKRFSSDVGINLIGRTSIRELLYLLINASLVIGNDSGVVHLADIHGVKNIIIFGPTSPTWTGSLSGKNIYLGLDCSPCNKRTCPLKHHNCMRKIEPDSVLQFALELLCSDATS